MEQSFLCTAANELLGLACSKWKRALRNGQEPPGHVMEKHTSEAKEKNMLTSQVLIKGNIHFCPLKTVAYVFW